MQLSDLVNGICGQSLDERFLNYDILSLSCDSRTIEPQSLFIAMSGSQYNGRDYIRDAIAKGAHAIILDEDTNMQGLKEFEDVCFIKTKGPEKVLSQLARRFYGNPSSKVKTIGVTGTNGKTTITYLLESIMQDCQKRCAVTGTINYRIGTEIIPSRNTTPGFLDNQQFLARLAEENIDYSLMEVSSHALSQGRVDLIDFCSAIFTNLTGDHLDYHKTMEAYFQAKSLLFRNLAQSSAAIINLDDPYGSRLMDMTPARVITYGVLNAAQIMARDIQSGFDGTSLKIIFSDKEIFLKTHLIGTHNVYNILAAAGAAFAENLPLVNIKKGIERLSNIPGRLEPVHEGQNFYIFIDYAHTEDGLRNVLQALRSTGKAKVITVFGCGGDRDRTKRPKMGKVACEMSDYSIVTTDNPRSEEPLSIIQEIVAGFSKENFEIVVDRTQAIEKALSLAKENDVVLIAGKGHETYQIFKDRTIDFDERVVVRNYLKRNGL